ncbi:MAG: bifunctional pyr operon transcriptional regulator/uracil phosphoribosyltransferase PyrR [Fibrobacterota bacterium]
MKKIRQLMTDQEIRRSLNRMSHQILEENRDLSALALIGIQTRGISLSKRLASIIEGLEKRPVPQGILDTSLYRDDYRSVIPGHGLRETDIPFDVKDRVIILVDDVLHTGRTVRAALDAIMDMGRPRAVKLAVLAERGGREIPIQPDYTGQRFSADADHSIALRVSDIDNEEDSLWLTQKEGA